MVTSTFKEKQAQPVGWFTDVSTTLVAYLIVYTIKYIPLLLILASITALMDGVRGNVSAQWLVAVITVPFFAGFLARGWLAQGRDQ